MGMEESSYEKYYYECLFCGTVTGRFNCKEGDLDAMKCPTICNSCRIGGNAHKEIANLRSQIAALVAERERLRAGLEFVKTPSFYAPGRAQRDRLIDQFLAPSAPSEFVAVRRKDAETARLWAIDCNCIAMADRLQAALQGNP